MPAVRNESEYRRVRLQSDLGRSTVGGAENAEARRLTFYFLLFTFYLEVQKMPNPKRRHSKSRTSKRRTHDTLVATQSSDCPNCREPKPPHRACPHCGYYRGRQVRAVDEA